MVISCFFRRYFRLFIVALWWDTFTYACCRKRENKKQNFLLYGAQTRVEIGTFFAPERNCDSSPDTTSTYTEPAVRLTGASTNGRPKRRFTTAIRLSERAGLPRPLELVWMRSWEQPGIFVTSSLPEKWAGHVHYNGGLFSQEA